MNTETYEWTLTPGRRYCYTTAKSNWLIRRNKAGWSAKAAWELEWRKKLGQAMWSDVRHVAIDRAESHSSLIIVLYRPQCPKRIGKVR